MAQVINTNLASLNAQRNLNKSQSSLNTSLQRLSSGVRINSAKDDAAGLQISNRFTSQIRGLNQAVRNANDGISIAQTAEGAMQESTNILQRMRELSLQSANGSNSADERAALQKEVGALQSELTRIADTTSFGGRKLLDGSFGTSSFQVGSQANETIDVRIGSAKADEIGLTGKSLTAAAETGLGGISTSGYTKGDSDSLSVQVGSQTKKMELSDGMSAAQLAGQYNGVQGLSGVSAFTGVKITAGASNTTATDTVKLNVQGVEINYTLGDDVDTSAAALNGALNQTTLDALADKGITVEYVDDAGEEGVIFKSATGENIDISASVTGGATDGGSVILTRVDSDGAVITGAENTTTITAAVDTTENESNVVTGSLDWSNATLDADYGAVTVTAGGTLGGGAVTVGADEQFNSVADIDISTAGGAQSAVDVIDAAIKSIDANRADLGAVQNRLESTIANLSNISENVSAAQSRILDTDFAAETANMSKNQILQQAGMSVLSQANSAPQQVLSLLQ
jgi:flagellin